MCAVWKLRDGTAIGRSKFASASMHPPNACQNFFPQPAFRRGGITKLQWLVTRSFIQISPAHRWILIYPRRLPRRDCEVRESTFLRSTNILERNNSGWNSFRTWEPKVIYSHITHSSPNHRERERESERRWRSFSGHSVPSNSEEFTFVGRRWARAMNITTIALLGLRVHL